MLRRATATAGPATGSRPTRWRRAAWVSGCPCSTGPARSSRALHRCPSRATSALLEDSSRSRRRSRRTPASGRARPRRARRVLQAASRARPLRRGRLPPRRHADEIDANVTTLAGNGVAYVTVAHLFSRRVAANAPAIPFLLGLGLQPALPHPRRGLTELGRAAVRAMYRERDADRRLAHAPTTRRETFALLDELDHEAAPPPTTPSSRRTRATASGGRTTTSTSAAVRTSQRATA